MNKAILFIVLLAVAVVCLLLLARKQSTPTMRENILVPLPNSNVIANPPVQSNATGTVTIERFTPWQRPPGVSDGSWAYALRLREVLLHANHPLDFYTRVVDQNNDPVYQAQMEFRITRVDEVMVASQAFLYMKEGSEQVFQTNILYSDSDGWIRLTGITGKELEVWSISKDGYISDYPRPSYIGMSYDYNGERIPSGNILATNGWNPSTGYTLHLWKKGLTERVIPVSIGVNLDNEIQGQWVSNYFVRFIPARVEWTNFAGADLMIQGIRRLSGNENRPYEFTFTLSVPNGGILLSDDAYPYHAPVTGYQTTWSFENHPQNNPPDFPWAKTCYLKLREGRMFVGLQLGFCNHGFDFSLNGYLNPNGSPNLEPDPDKLITDPDEIRRIDEQTRVR